ncbi:hypothetical protein FHS43_000435 [Streptosporangium becharense]|uniref:Uncharacterized protein n=1 Tax=Streptosporangium becharense TaxID=1816182 RepID=A0A7W9MG69_9ACTN|nr:hypothetical protein [Streptosporangium becharense]MBB2909189.1 hypothetical protein [Streptosporangium becharense]MBB5819792.1 hypothetical protein [Streptosporangium becharense]
MWFLDRTIRQLRSSPAVLTHRPPDPAALEAVLRRYAEAPLGRSGDWFVVGARDEVKVRWVELTPEQASAAGVPADRRGAIVLSGGDRTLRSFIVNTVAGRLGGAVHPPAAIDDYLDVEVRMRKSGGVGCDEAARMIRPFLGERIVEHDHSDGVCRLVATAGDPVEVTYNWPVADPEHIVDLELDVRGPADLPAVEALYRAASAIAEATGATVVCKDFLVTRLEDLIPSADRLPG